MQEAARVTTKSVKKSRKPKKEAREFVQELGGVQLSQDPIWALLESNAGLQLNFALNQILRQCEILSEN